MAAVGYDLYCKMLGEAVKKEKGGMVEEHFDTTIDLDIDAYLPETYVVSEEQRLDLYKRIALIDSEEGRDEMLDELIDRFRRTIPFCAKPFVYCHAPYGGSQGICHRHCTKTGGDRFYPL